MAGLIPAGRRQPLWWTLRRPVRPLTYHAVHRMFERVNRQAGTAATLHSLRHTAAYRMAEDPALPLTDVQLVLGHAQLTTTQIYLTPRKEDVIRRVLAHHAEQARQAAERASAGPGAWLPARDPGRLVRRRARHDRRHRSGRCCPAGAARRERALGPGSPRARRRPDWPATTARPGGGAGTADPPAVHAWTRRQPGQPDARADGAAGLAGRPAGTQLAGAVAGQRRRRAGAGMAAGARPVAARAAAARRLAAGRAVRGARDGDLRRRHPARAAGSPAARSAGGALAGGMAAARDPAGFARLRGCATATRGVSRPRAARCTGPPSSSRPRAAAWPTSPPATSWSCWTPRTSAHARPRRRTPRCSTGCCTRSGSSGQAPPTLRRAAHRGQRSAGELIDRYHLACRPVRDLLVDYLRERQPALDYSSLESLASLAGAVLAGPGTPPPRHRQPAPARRGRRRLEAAAADQAAKTVTATAGEKTEVDRPAAELPRVPDPGAGLLPGPGAMGGRGPGRWGPWVAPCPVGAAEINRRKAARHRKSRMDARTRERLPVLPVLVRAVERAAQGRRRRCWQQPAAARPGRRSPPPGRP